MKGRKKKKRDQGLEEGNLKSGRKPLTSSAFSRASPSLFNYSFTHTHGVALLLSLALFFFFSLVLCAFVYAGIRRCDMMEHKEAISNANLSHNTINDEIFADYCDGIFADDPAFPFKNRDILNDLLSYSEQAETSLWSQNLKPRQSSVSAAIDSQSSICVGSPMSTTKPKDKANVTTSGSSRELSDNEDLEIEAGPCEQSTDPTDLKRMRRMVSNKESARRSRKRKQAHLADLEFQVEKLRGENSSVYEQLTGAIQQYCEADTNNRVLESDVEALRAKVTLAEDMVARGCNLNQLLQNHLNPSSLLSSQSLRRLANVSPTVTVRVHGDGAYAGMAVSGQNSSVGLVNADINNNCNCNLRSDCGSCVSDVWP